VTARTRFEAIYLAEAPTVLLFARHRVGRDLAEDVVAETFAVAWRKIDDVPASPRPWLLAVARKVSANHARAARRHDYVSLDDALAKSDPRTDIEDQVADREQLLSAVRQLHPRDRETVLLATWYGLSQKEAAQAMGCSSAAFAVRLHRARRRLRQILTEANATLRPAPAEAIQ